MKRILCTTTLAILTSCTAAQWQAASVALSGGGQTAYYKAQAPGCSQDTQCWGGQRCVVGAYDGVGKCMSVVDGNRQKVYAQPRLGNITHRVANQMQCRWDAECSVGGECVNGNCVVR